MTNRAIYFLSVFFSFLTTENFAQEFPPRPDPPRLVNDFTQTISANEQQLLENKLVAFDDSTSVQLAVVILKSLDGYPPGDYAFQLAQRWGIGQKETNNGALLLISMEERKMFIATGYGLEGRMPDALCRRIIENDIKPFFKQQKYFEGIDAGTSQMMALVSGEYKATSKKVRSRPVPLLPFLVAGLFILLIFVFRIRSARSYAALNSVPFWVAWQILNAASNRHRGKWTDFNSGRGSFGGWSGGGGSSGGFGGFGGGSFGGGGAGGSW